MVSGQKPADHLVYTLGVIMKKFRDLKKYQKQRIGFLVFVVVLIVVLIASISGIKENTHTDIDDIKNAQISYDTVIFVGSNFTRGTKAHHKSFVDYLKNEFDADILSITGTKLKMVSKKKKEISYTKLIDAVPTDGKTPRAVFCEISYFDAKEKSKIGKLSDSYDDADFDTKTVYGSLEHIAYLCKEVYHCPFVFYTYPYCNSNKYEKLIEVANDVANKWNGIVFDFYNDENFWLNKNQKKQYMANKICPNSKGYDEVFNPAFEQMINNHYPDILDKNYFK